MSSPPTPPPRPGLSRTPSSSLPDTDHDRGCECRSNDAEAVAGAAAPSPAAAAAAAAEREDTDLAVGESGEGCSTLKTLSPFPTNALDAPITASIAVRDSTSTSPSPTCCCSSSRLPDDAPRSVISCSFTPRLGELAATAVISAARAAAETDAAAANCAEATMAATARSGGRSGDRCRCCVRARDSAVVELGGGVAIPIRCAPAATTADPIVDSRAVKPLPLLLFLGGSSGDEFGV